MEQFEREADIAEAKYTPLVMRLVSAPEVIGLHRAISKRIAMLNAEAKAETDRQMRERSPKVGIGSKAFRDLRRSR